MLSVIGEGRPMIASGVEKTDLVNFTGPHWQCKVFKMYISTAEVFLHKVSRDGVSGQPHLEL